MAEAIALWRCAHGIESRGEQMRADGARTLNWQMRRLMLPGIKSYAWVRLALRTTTFFEGVVRNAVAVTCRNTVVLCSAGAGVLPVCLFLCVCASVRLCVCVCVCLSVWRCLCICFLLTGWLAGWLDWQTGKPAASSQAASAPAASQ